MEFTPRFPVTPYTELRYITGYEVNNTLVDVRYVLKDDGMRYDIYSPAKNISSHILLPSKKQACTVLVNGKEHIFKTSTVGKSNYVDFDLKEIQGETQQIEILFT